MIKQHRENADLVQMIADLQKRISTLESASRLGSASIDGGELTVRGGDINVRSVNDNLVTKIQHGVIPTIQYFPGDIASPTSRTTIFGWQYDDGASLEARCELMDSTISGGKLLLLPNGLYLSVQRPAKAEAYLSIAQDSAYPEHFRFQGRWISDNQFTSADALVMGQLNVGAGFGAAAFSFIHPFDEVPIVLYSTVETGGGSVVTSGLSALDQSGFTVAWTGSTAKFINWVAFRV